VAGTQIWRASRVALAGLVLASSAASAQDMRSVIENAQTRAVHAGTVTSIPMDVRMGKLFVRATANGVEREFIFDTGSPSIISEELAAELGLEIVASNTGRDANGDPVTMGIAVLDTLDIGTARFEQIPVMVFDFSSLPTGRCVVDGGVIGSELLPHGVWRLDTERGEMTIAPEIGALTPSAGALDLELMQAGYPFPPVISYRLGDVEDRALFDTGSAGFASVFESVMNSRQARSAIVPGSLREGEGSEGESAGGRGPVRSIAHYELSRLELGGLTLEAVPALSRSNPPTLVGAGLLDRYAVTIDFARHNLVLEPRAEMATPDRPAGFALAYTGRSVEVVQLFAGTAAAQAGLMLGDEVVSVDGQALDTTESGVCNTVRWLAGTFDAASVSEIVVMRDAEQIALTIRAEGGR
jgi:hypothetical protein